MEKLVLASASPRRRELLELMGVAHDAVPSTVDEGTISADHPRTFALRAAYAKAHEVAARTEPGRWVLGADTVVTRRMVLFGKPGNRTEAQRMLSVLSGETHDVITGMCLVKAGTDTSFLDSATTRVTFRTLHDFEIDHYINSGEPFDKAGAYGIQGAGGDLVDGIEGDYYNVVGLPCELLLQMLSDAGVDVRGTVPATPERWRAGVR